MTVILGCLVIILIVVKLVDDDTLFLIKEIIGKLPLLLLTGPFLNHQLAHIQLLQIF